jgi:hypothetical protein
MEATDSSLKVLTSPEYFDQNKPENIHQNNFIQHGKFIVISLKVY